MRMEIKKCLKCGKTYTFNPPAGKLGCPYCKGLSRKQSLFGRKSN